MVHRLRLTQVRASELAHIRQDGTEYPSNAAEGSTLLAWGPRVYVFVRFSRVVKAAMRQG